MKIHNILEEQVISRVNTIYDDKDIQAAQWFHCGCEQCRLDTTAYVLNRLKPRYVVSERGIAHHVSEQGSQLDADLDFLIIEGIKKVSSVRRSFHGKEDLFDTDVNELESAFNFPIFLGSVYDGNTFKPMPNGTVTITSEQEIIEMVDETWFNPYSLHDQTKGAYTFWIKPIKTEHYEEKKVFNFFIEVRADNYETTRYAFSYPITSTKQERPTPDTTNHFKIDDLYIFPVDES